MGRLFSTIYRIILVGVSVAALVFSVMSATSCAFVKFDHQYKSEGRQLADSNVDVDHAATAGEDRGSKRLLQTDGESAPSIGDTIANITVDPTDTNVTTDTADMTAEEQALAVADAEATAAAEALAAVTTEDNATEATEVAEDTAAPVAAPDSVTISPQPSIAVPASDQDADPSQISDAEVPGVIVEDPEYYEPEDYEPGDEDTAPGEDQYSGLDELENELSGYDPTANFGDDEGSASASESSSTANGASQAAATASGDAGLYCDGAQSFSVTNLWGQSAQELKDDLVSMSDNNQSEELARGGVVAACMFGLVMVFILIMESVIGWRMCCERWIVGLVALCASVSQGITFLFFNSERYCDGDIVHEIINQEPCVLGQGGFQSVIAIVLYAIALVMACRLPQDDPYGLCCKERSAARNRDRAGGSSMSGSKFGPLSGIGSDIGGPDSADSDYGGDGRQRERPNWMPEDKEKEENEII